MKTIDHDGRRFVISSHSDGPDPKTCVAVAFPGTGVPAYQVRDSTDMTGGALDVSREAWRGLVARVKAGELDLR